MCDCCRDRAGSFGNRAGAADRHREDARVSRIASAVCGQSEAGGGRCGNAIGRAAHRNPKSARGCNTRPGLIDHPFADRNLGHFEHRHFDAGKQRVADRRAIVVGGGNAVERWHRLKPVVVPTRASLRADRLDPGAIDQILPGLNRAGGLFYGPGASQAGSQGGRAIFDPNLSPWIVRRRRGQGPTPCRVTARENLRCSGIGRRKFILYDPTRSRAGCSSKRALGVVSY